MTRKHSHYHKDVSHLKSIDVYRVLELFEVTDHALGHAIKKLICAGKRGSKSFETDVREAADTLNRRLQMLAEDDNQLPVSATPVAHMGGVPAASFSNQWIWHTITGAPPFLTSKMQVEFYNGRVIEGLHKDLRKSPNWSLPDGHPDRIKRYRWFD